jgi:hypothetical protein
VAPGNVPSLAPLRTIRELHRRTARDLGFGTREDIESLLSEVQQLLVGIAIMQARSRHMPPSQVRCPLSALLGPMLGACNECKFEICCSRSSLATQSSSMPFINVHFSLFYGYRFPRKFETVHVRPAFLAAEQRQLTPSLKGSGLQLKAFA